MDTDGYKRNAFTIIKQLDKKKNKTITNGKRITNVTCARQQ